MESLLLITAQYFRLESLLLVSAHYYSLLPITSFNVHIFTFYFYCSNGLITASLPLHYYIQSSITTITAHYFNFITYHYFHYCLLLPHLVLHFYLITPELWFECPLLSITSTFPSITVLHCYCIITASLLQSVEHYYHYFSLLPPHYFSLLQSMFSLLPITQVSNGK